MGNELTGDVWRIDLPSGGWIQIRSKMTVEDQRAVQGAVDVEIRSDGDGNSVARLPGDHALARRTALLARIITNWGGPGLEGIPVPANNIAGAAVMGSHLDSKDYNVLAAAVQPLLDEMAPTPPNSQGTAATPSSSSSQSS